MWKWMGGGSAFSRFRIAGDRTRHAQCFRTFRNPKALLNNASNSLILQEIEFGKYKCNVRFRDIVKVRQNIEEIRIDVSTTPSSGGAPIALNIRLRGCSGAGTAAARQRSPHISQIKNEKTYVRSNNIISHAQNNCSSLYEPSSSPLRIVTLSTRTYTHTHTRRTHDTVILSYNYAYKSIYIISIIIVINVVIVTRTTCSGGPRETANRHVHSYINDTIG